MKPQEKIAIDNLRMEGVSPGDIALQLHLSANTVRSYIRRHPAMPGVKHCANCGKPLVQSPGAKRKSSARMPAGCTGGTRTLRTSTGKHTIRLTAALAERSFKAMVTEKDNSAAGTAMSAPDSTYSPENLLRYHTALALLEKLTQDGLLSQHDYRKSCTILRCKYGLPSGSIFAETA